MWRMVATSTEIMKYLLSCKVPAHAKDSMGRTPFYLACARGHLECVKLLGQGSINIRDNYGDTPLLAACTGAQALDVVTCLLERDADIEARVSLLLRTARAINVRRPSCA